MNKKKGFTLIEVLAVIAVLAIIALIAVPLVANQIETSRKASFKASVLEASKGLNIYLNRNQIKMTPGVEDGAGVSIETLKKEDLISKLISGRFVEIDNKVYAYFISDGKYCAYGPMDDLIINKDCKKLNPSAPTIDENALIIQARTTNSIEVQVDESKIHDNELNDVSYTLNLYLNSKQIKSQKQINGQKIYTFKGLKADTEYNIELVVTNSAMKQSKQSKTAKTLKIVKPEFIINSSSTLFEKNITIKYHNENIADPKYYFKVIGDTSTLEISNNVRKCSNSSSNIFRPDPNSCNETTNKISSNTWYQTDDMNQVMILKKNAIIIANTYDGVNYSDSNATLSISFPTTIEFDNSDTTCTTSKSIPITYSTGSYENADKYFMVTKGGNTSSKEVYECGNGTKPGTCSSNKTTKLRAEYWYKTDDDNPDLNINSENTSIISTIFNDGKQITSKSLTINNIDTTAPVITISIYKYINKTKGDLIAGPITTTKSSDSYIMNNYWVNYGYYFDIKISDTGCGKDSLTRNWNWNNSGLTSTSSGMQPNNKSIFDTNTYKPTITASGIRTAEVVVTDAAGNTTRYGFSGFVDTSTPSIPTSTVRQNNSTGTVVVENVKSYNSESSYTNKTLWWGGFSSTGSPSGIARYEYSSKCTGEKSGNLNVDNGHTYSSNNETHKFCIRAVNNVGTASEWSEPYYFNIDKVAPTPKIILYKTDSDGNKTGSALGTYTDNINLSSNWVNYGYYFDIATGSTDTGSGIKSMKWEYNSAGIYDSSYNKSLSASTYTSLHNVTLTGSGKRYGKITLTDNAGNTATKTVSVSIDKVAPTLKIALYAADNSGNKTGGVLHTYDTDLEATNTWMKNGYYFDIATNSSDTGSGIKSMTWQYNNSEIYDSSYSKSLSTSTYTSLHNVSFTGSGIRYGVVKLTDNAGNTTTGKITVKVDNTAPKISSFTVSGTNMTAKAQDLGSGIVAYAFTKNSTTPADTTWKNITKTNASISETYTATSNGTWYFHVKDANGNTSSKSVSVTGVSSLTYDNTTTSSIKKFYYKSTSDSCSNYTRVSANTAAPSIAKKIQIIVYHKNASSYEITKGSTVSSGWEQMGKIVYSSTAHACQDMAGFGNVTLGSIVYTTTDATRYVRAKLTDGTYTQATAVKTS